MAAGLLSYQFYNDKVLGFNANIYSLAEPFYKIAYYPIEVKKNISEWLSEKESVIGIKEQLELENVTLKAQLQTLESLKLENNRLMELLKASKNFDFEYQLGEVLNASIKPYSHQIVVNKGLVDGVYQGQPVIDDLGVLGQVSSVSLNHALVTLITNSSQAVPVIVQRNGLRVIVQGTASGDKMIINYVEAESDIQEGDLLVTSGLGQLYPKGYPVAQVSLRNDATDQPFVILEAKPVARLKNSNHVILIWPKPNDDNNEEFNEETLNSEILKLGLYKNSDLKESLLSQSLSSSVNNTTVAFND